MTCGIYILRFKGTNKVYVGQAYNMEKRFIRHVFTLRTGVASKKMNEAYNKYGTPELESLIECEEKELFKEELAAIQIFDAIDNGFNSVEAMTRTIIKGENHGMAVCSNEEIEEAFNLLVDNPKLRQADIASIVGIPEKVVNLISCGINHRWLQDKYPDRYAIMLVPKKSGPKNSDKYKTLVSPTGIEYEVTNISQFSKEHGINATSVGRLLRGLNLTTKTGWSVK